MPITHKIKTHTGDIKERKLTVGQAVRYHCVECVCSVYGTETCGGEEILPENLKCVFYPYRNGKGRPSVKLIRKMCLRCMGGQRKLVEFCSTETCPLWPFRMGKIPNYMSQVRLKALSERMKRFNDEK